MMLYVLIYVGQVLVFSCNLFERLIDRLEGKLFAVVHVGLMLSNCQVDC